MSQPLRWVLLRSHVSVKPCTGHSSTHAHSRAATQYCSCQISSRTWDPHMLQVTKLHQGPPRPLHHRQHHAQQLSAPFTAHRALHKCTSHMPVYLCAAQSAQCTLHCVQSTSQVAVLRSQLSAPFAECQDPHICQCTDVRSAEHRSCSGSRGRQAAHKAAHPALRRARHPTP